MNGDGSATTGHGPSWARLLALAGIWGSAFAATRSAVAGLPPLTVATTRIALGAAIALLLSRAAGLSLPRDRARLWALVRIGVTGYALPFALIAWGQQRVDSGLAGLLMAVMPLATLGLVRALLPSEPLGARRLVGFGFGFAGIAVLVGPTALAELGGSGGEVVRQAAVLGGALCYALNAVLVRLSPPMHALPLTAGALLVASALLAPFALALDAPWLLAPGPGALLAVAFLGVVATGLASYLYFTIIERSGPSFLAQMNFMIPFVALATGAMVHGEEPSGNALFALGLLLLGLWLGQPGVPSPGQSGKDRG